VGGQHRQRLRSRRRRNSSSSVSSSQHKPLPRGEGRGTTSPPQGRTTCSTHIRHAPSSDCSTPTKPTSGRGTTTWKKPSKSTIDSALLLSASLLWLFHRPGRRRRLTRARVRALQGQTQTNLETNRSRQRLYYLVQQTKQKDLKIIYYQMRSMLQENIEVSDIWIIRLLRSAALQSGGPPLVYR